MLKRLVKVGNLLRYLFAVGTLDLLHNPACHFRVGGNLDETAQNHPLNSRFHGNGRVVQRVYYT